MVPAESSVRERRRAETVREIKEAALAQLAEVGPGALSLRGVARAVGMTVQSLYHYFPSRDALLSRLTTREAQVLERIVAGRLNKQIADDLGISIKTVEAHRANIMEKLNANTVADLLKIALGAHGKA